VWIDIKDYEGIYQVNSEGQVKSLDRLIPYRGGMAKRKGIIIKPHTLKTGYKYVGLSKLGVVKYLKLHRLVGTTFIQNPFEYKYINHKDMDKGNNCVGNLEWVSAKQNNIHKLINLGGPKLTFEDVETIREEYWVKHQKTIVELAALYNVTPTHIRSIIHYRRWNSPLYTTKYKGFIKGMHPMEH